MSFLIQINQGQTGTVKLEKAEIAKSERVVICVIDAIKSSTNPFDIANKDKLYCLASGAPVSAVVETGVLQEEVVRDASKMEFNQSLQNGDADCFFNPIKKKKLKTMETLQ